MKEKTYLHTLKTAEKLFNRFGFAKTAMADVAKAAEVSRATIFNNFGNKNGLLKAVLDNKRKEFRAEILDCFRKTHSASGRLRALLIERIRMLSAMKFITEDAISVDNAAINQFYDEMDLFFLDKTEETLKKGSRKKDEVKGLVNTIVLMMKGLEQGISDHIESFSIKQVEKDIDFFLKLAVPEGSDKVNCL